MDLTTLIRKVFDEEITDDKGDKKIKGLLMIKAMYEKALTGDVRAFKALAERMEGMPKQQIEVESVHDVYLSNIINKSKDTDANPTD